MQYDNLMQYNEPNYTYTGTLVIRASSLINPIIVNNVSIIAGLGGIDLSNRTIIGVLSIDTSPEGVLTIQVIDENVSALFGVDSIINLGGGLVSVTYQDGGESPSGMIGSDSVNSTASASISVS